MFRKLRYNYLNFLNTVSSTCPSPQHSRNVCMSVFTGAHDERRRDASAEGELAVHAPRARAAPAPRRRQVRTAVDTHNDWSTNVLSILKVDSKYKLA